MIAADTSSLIAYFVGEPGRDVEVIGEAFERRQLALPPVVLTELLSDSQAATTLAEHLVQLPLLAIEPDFWRRAGKLRAKVLDRGYKSRVADALIAQSCIDHGVALITRDRDFRHYARIGGLKLVT